MKNRLFSLVLTSFLVLTMFGCGGGDSGTSDTGKSDKLVIISPHPKFIEDEFTIHFKRWYKEQTGRDVMMEWLDQGGTSDDLKYVRSEFKRSPDGIGIDIFFGGGTSPFITMANEGLLERYRLPDYILADIPPDLKGVPIYDPEYRWYGTVLSGFGIMSNKLVVSRLGLPVVESWEDLGDPRLLGQIAAADPSKSGSAHLMFELILQSTGWEKGTEIITRLGGNARNFTAGSNDAVKEVSTGQTAYALAIDFYAYTEMNTVGEENIGYVVPKESVVYNADSIAILKGAPNLPVAQKFLEFVMSKRGQKLWMLRPGDPEGPEKENLFRASVIPSLYEELAGRTVVKNNPFKAESLFIYDNEKGSTRWTIINDLISSMVINTHSELVDAWKAVIKGGMKPAALAELIKMPVTEEELMTLAKEKWNDQGFRNMKISEWTNFAKAKYEKAKQLAK